MMDGMYEPQRQFTAEDMQRYTDMSNQQDAMMHYMHQGVNDQNGLMDNSMGDGSHREKMHHRRRNPHHSMSMDGARPIVGPDPRRASMLEFGSGSDAGLDTYQFNPGSLPSNSGMQRPSNLAQRRLDSQRLRRHMSQEDLSLNTNYSNMPPFDMTNHSPYGHAMHSADSMSGVDIQNDYNMLLGMDFTSTPLDHMNDREAHSHEQYIQNNMQDMTPTLNRSVSHGLPASIPSKAHDPGGGVQGNMARENVMEKHQNMQIADQPMPQQQEPIPAPDPNAGMPLNSQDMAMTTAPPAPTFPTTQAQSNVPLDASDVKNAPFNSNSQVVPQYRNAYSSSGFDMLGVLMRVASRPNPQINLGAVDMSCAFVVCDVTQHDIPIVYCSDVFERLTAYTRHEILGRNCRFLQSPDGKIQTGVRRKYVDDKSVLRIKNLISQRQEAQVSLINYRKGGQPFMNLLTMIPITWDDPNEIKYYVGFQVDLVEQPTSITNKNPDGTYSINYQRGLLPRYVIPEANKEQNPEAGQTIHRDDVSTVLSTIGSGESELSKRIWDKVLLENTDDVVHVLSLKGLFLYLSPSSRKILEYDPSELVGTPLSSVCHPSDIVPVTRELKDTSTGAAVNVVFRIRRKHNGYTWFESHGSLHLEQGKGRKCIIMVGRERPVYALARDDVMTNGGFGESELWTKMSTSGMFLFISSNVRSLLDRQPEDLIGTSAQALMRQESKLEFGQKLEMARSGVKTTLKHDVENKRGQTLQAQTTIYPGDATEGQKPTFLVAQTRLLKLSRHKSSTTSSAPIEAKSTSPTSSSGTPVQNAANPNINSITTQAGGSGLLIGNQHEALASEDNVFDELKTTRSTSWQFELRQMEKRNRLLAEELQGLLSSKKKRKRRNGPGNTQKDCANCHTRVTPEWRRGPSGNRDLCNSCGLRWAKENGRITPRTSSNKSSSPVRTNSDGMSKSFGKTSSPRNNPSNSPNQELRSPQNISADSHTAKTSRMEAPAGPGFGGGIPAKIEEGVEM